MSRDAPYPEIKKSHTMAHKGRPWRDYKPPASGPVWGVINAGSTYWMLVAAIDLGIFDALEWDETASLQVMAERVGASPYHLQHLLDVMVTLGFLDQVRDEYFLTETAERYLRRDGAASMADLVRVSPGPLENWTGLGQTIRDGTVAKPIEDDAAGFYGPLVMATFVTQFRAASRLGLKLGWASTPNMRVLDLGAGCAPWALAALDQSPGSTAVVNDWPAIIPLAQGQVDQRGMTDRVTFRPGDFHTIPIEAGAYDLVAICHICRTEGHELAPALIARAVNALKPGGRLVLADYFADNDRKMNPFGVQMGMTMMANTVRGGLITYRDVRDWLAAQPLESIRLMEPIGFNPVFVATKTAST